MAEPVQDTLLRVARAIYEARDVISIPREGIETAPFEMVWKVESCRQELLRQARAALAAARSPDPTLSIGVTGDSFPQKGW